MRRLLSHLLGFVLLATEVAASAASGSAPVPCGTVASAAADGSHYEGDADEVAADEDGGFPHHHGVGHDHGVGLAHANAAIDLDSPPKTLPVATRQQQTAGAPADPALRPPAA